VRRILSILVLGCLSCVSLWAQATAQISGAARDQSGAVLPGVEITVTQTDTGINRSTVTNETGSYVLPNLAVGPYKLEASLPGFRTYVQTGIVLQVNSNPVLNVVLEVGQVSEQVEVQANAALVETRNSTVGSVVENERILELPLNGRNVTDLITLSGGSVDTNPTGGGTIANLSIGASPVLAITGGAAWGADYMLDGARHVNYMSGTTMAMPFPDAMQEFKVETTGATANSTYSAAVSAVTKAGTNQFHGDLFEFVRNDLFNATQYFAGVNPVTGNKRNSTLKRNQFGGTAGGALIQNKLFFFGGYQGTTLRQDPQNTQAFIPTAAMLAGDWTAFTSPACNAGRQVTLRTSFVNNRIDPAQYSKAALFVVNWKGNLPFPTTSDPCGQITYGTPSAENDGSYVGKIDYQKSAKHSLFGRVLFTSLNTPNPFPTDTQYLQGTGYASGLATSFTFGSTYLVGANMVQSFRLTFNRNANHYNNVAPGQLFNWCDAGVKIYCEPIIARLIGNSITGGFPLNGSGFIKGHRYVGTMYSVSDDVSLVRGTHQIAFGGSVDNGRQNSLAPYTSTHQFTFNGSAAGLGLADFMLGKPSQLITGRTNFHHVRGLLVGLYSVDSWKASRKVTVNYGVRYEPSLPPWVEDTYNFDMNRFLQGIRSSVFLNAPAGLYYRGDPGFPDGSTYSHWLQFSPHVGIAWDVNGDGRTSIRTSYGFSYVPAPGDFRERYSGTGPWGGRVTLTSPIGGLDNPYLGVPGGDVFPYVVDKNSPYTPYGWIYTQPYDLPTPYQQSWNFTIQRQVGKDWLVSGSYLGTNMIHLWGNQSLNPAINIPGASCTINGVSYSPCSNLNNTDARRLFSILRPADGAKIGYAAQADGGGIQRYNGLLLSLEHRAVKGVTVTGNYTLSHCIGPYVTLYDFRALWPYETYTNPLNRDADRGNCDSDRRQLFNLTSVAATPQFSNSFLRTVATGWRVSGIYKFSSGAPLNVEAGSDRSLTGINHQRPNQVLADPYSGHSSPLGQWINPAAFALPDMSTIGNVGHNSIVGPRTWSFDIGLSRTFNVREMQRLEIRAEAFNVLNSFRPGAPTVSSLTSNTFGQIRTSLDPRIMQFALKYVF